MNSKRGSLWRKWDLHIHSPVSVHNNQFEGRTIEEKWEKYGDKLKSLRDFSVLGITDYFSVEGYKYVRDNISLPNIDLILPNVELRILPVTGSQTPINIHVIFDPEIVDTLDSKFFSSLTFTYKNQLYRCIRPDLIKLGKAFSNNEGLEDDSAYKIGVEQFNISFRDLDQALKDDSELQSKALILVANGSHDGNSGIQQSHLAATRQEIYSLSHCIFSANPQDSTYFLGQGVDSPEVIIQKHGSLKPCVHGSDAHHLDQIGLPCAKRADEGHRCNVNSKDCDFRYCWIKSDPSFEGLRQILYEPEERVKIQNNSPYEDHKKVHLDTLDLNGSINFIVPNSSLLLNRELVAVIGGRGSGKSALLELIGFMNEEHTKSDQNKKPKLIEYYRKNYDLKTPAPGFSFSTSLINKDNNIQKYSKDLVDTTSLALPFLYIGQEELSRLATNDKSLTLKVCELLNLNFTELESDEYVDKARTLIAEINILRAELIDLQLKYPEYDKKIGFEKWLKELIEMKAKQKTTLSSKETKELVEEVTKQIDRHMKLGDFLSDLNDLQVTINTQLINKSITKLNDAQKDLYKDDSKLIPQVNYQTQLQSIQTIRKEVNEEVKSLTASIESNKTKFSTLGIKEDITALVSSIEAIQRDINLDFRNLELYGQKYRALQQKVKDRNSLYENIKTQVNENKKTIDTKFQEFKKSRDGSTLEEQGLFSALIEDIDIEGAVELKQEEFCKYILDNCVDRRKIKSINDIKELIAGKANGIVNEVNLENLAKWVQEGLDAFLRGENFNDSGAQKLIEYLFTKWHNFVVVKTIAKLKGIPTEKLSVGQRGTLLLKIYLATASVKQIFIVDQPEDNLDNHFIMNQLVPLIRKIKKSRQIILSTHNANLVVNADAEQIIVANLDQNSDKDYLSGAIENPLINQKIKDILEGGEMAFINREKKYGYKHK